MNHAGKHNKKVANTTKGANTTTATTRWQCERIFEMSMKQSIHGVMAAMMVAALGGSCVPTDLPEDETSTELEVMVVPEPSGGAATAGGAEPDGQLNGTLALGSDTIEAGCASVTSEPQPQSGQDHRSSGNFSTEGCGGTQLRWTCPEGIEFDVMKDVSLGQDPTIFSHVSNGEVTSMYQDRSLYIANPTGASSNFTVAVEGI